MNFIFELSLIMPCSYVYRLRWTVGQTHPLLSFASMHGVGSLHYVAPAHIHKYKHTWFAVYTKQKKLSNPYKTVPLYILKYIPGK